MPRRSLLREFPLLLLVALTIAFLLRTFIIQVFWIPSSSMVPTLQVDDRMVVEKVTYRVRAPERGDVVVFRAERPTEPVAGPVWRRAAVEVVRFIGFVPLDASDLVKRVAALPGEEVQLIAGVLHVDGVPFAEPYRASGDRSEFGPVVVPDGHYFFLGDNRANSSDSRGRLGFVAAERVVGRAVVVVWPTDHVRLLTRDAPQALAAVPGS